MKSFSLTLLTREHTITIVTQPLLVFPVFYSRVHWLECVVWHIRVQYMVPLTLEASITQVYFTFLAVVTQLVTVLAVRDFARGAVPQSVWIGVDYGGARLL